jgi:hypothetical protein
LRRVQGRQRHRAEQEREWQNHPWVGRSHLPARLRGRQKPGQTETLRIASAMRRAW